MLYAATPCYAEVTNLATFQAGFGNTACTSLYYLEYPPRKRRYLDARTRQENTQATPIQADKYVKGSASDNSIFKV